MNICVLKSMHIEDLCDVLTHGWKIPDLVHVGYCNLPQDKKENDLCDFCVSNTSYVATVLYWQWKIDVYKII